jgi:hypothetical protein
VQKNYCLVGSAAAEDTHSGNRAVCRGGTASQAVAVNQASQVLIARGAIVLQYAKKAAAAAAALHLKSQTQRMPLANDNNPLRCEDSSS